MMKTKRYHYDAAAHARDHRERYFGNGHHRGSYVDASGEYHCIECGNAWRAESIRVYWPVSVGLSWRSWWRWFRTHGWQVGYDGIERRVFGWTLHLGPVKIMFGKDRDRDRGNILQTPPGSR